MTVSCDKLIDATSCCFILRYSPLFQATSYFWSPPTPKIFIFSAQVGDFGSFCSLSRN